MTRNRMILAAPLALMLGATPVAAQDAPDDDGQSLMQEGARLFWDGFKREMGPALESLRDHAEEMEPALRDFVDEMGPALRDLMDEVGDLSRYHAPEVLPNGDIILRRKAPKDERDAPAVPETPEGEIEI